ncbi:MAG: hypothetical protein EZS28_030212, partial [Streblomastix strix]
MNIWYQFLITHLKLVFALFLLCASFASFSVFSFIYLLIGLYFALASRPQTLQSKKGILLDRFMLIFSLIIFCTQFFLLMFSQQIFVQVSSVATRIIFGKLQNFTSIEFALELVKLIALLGFSGLNIVISLINLKPKKEKDDQQDDENEDEENEEEVKYQNTSLNVQNTSKYWIIPNMKTTGKSQQNEKEIENINKDEDSNR